MRRYYRAGSAKLGGDAGPGERRKSSRRHRGSGRRKSSRRGEFGAADGAKLGGGVGAADGAGAGGDPRGRG